MPISLDVPGRNELVLEHLVLDLNGTLTNHGELIEGVAERIERLGEKLEVQLLSADTYGVLAGVSTELQAHSRTVTTGDEKARCIWELGPERCAAIGNGANDAPMLEIAALGVAVVGPEGTAAAALRAADVVCSSILDALDLLLDERALVATLRL
ncbi:MAG TPA: HAD hydrolase family protein [Gaiellaceae bacterium]|nr:HAD hydrolase family protein [Gaiellaceae bacterium]